MSDSARVTSIPSVADFLGSLRRFEETVEDALLSLDQQVARALDWFDGDCPTHWKQTVQRCFNLVAETRAQLEACKMKRVAGHRPSCYEEKQNHLAAKQKLQQSQETVKAVRKWSIRLHHDADEYRGRIGRLRRFLEGDFARTINLMERTLASLEAYAGSTGPPPDSTAANEEGGTGTVDDT